MSEPIEWSSAVLTDRLAAYLVNAYTDGRGYDPADPDDVAVTLKDGFAIVIADMKEAQHDWRTMALRRGDSRPRVCDHGIYRHGCPSCDRQDPEERL